MRVSFDQRSAPFFLFFDLLPRAERGNEIFEYFRNKTEADAVVARSEISLLLISQACSPRLRGALKDSFSGSSLSPLAEIRRRFSQDGEYHSTSARHLAEWIFRLCSRLLLSSRERENELRAVEMFNSIERRREGFTEICFPSSWERNFPRIIKYTSSRVNLTFVRPYQPSCRSLFNPLEFNSLYCIHVRR